MTPFVEYDAPGLPADWLNAWLAAIGVTVLLPDVKLSWADDVVPHAVFYAPDGADLAQEIFDMLPTVPELSSTAIAREHPDSQHQFKRNVSLNVYQDRARLERRDGGFLLAATVSDLAADADLNNLPHGAFDPTAPRGETLYSRAVRCREALDELQVPDAVTDMLAGQYHRVQANGLGFDCRRLVTGVRAGQVYVDPTIELLALSGLACFPVRGGPRTVRQRGFTLPPSRRGAFKWSCWSEPLDRWGIDAILDIAKPGGPTWQLVPYSVPPPDNTRAYFSEPVP